MTASPGNVLGTLAVDPPAGLSVTAGQIGAVQLVWGASPTGALRAVDYVVSRRTSGSSAFADVWRTPALGWNDAPGPGTYDYAVRAVISSFASANTAVATVTTTP